jgi:hypothetical protein
MKMNGIGKQGNQIFSHPTKHVQATSMLLNSDPSLIALELQEYDGEEERRDEAEGYPPGLIGE